MQQRQVPPPVQATLLHWGDRRPCEPTAPAAAARGPQQSLLAAAQPMPAWSLPAHQLASPAGRRWGATELGPWQASSHSTNKCFCRQSSAKGQLVTAGTYCAKSLAAEGPEHEPSLLQKAFWVAGGAQCPSVALESVLAVGSAPAWQCCSQTVEEPRVLWQGVETCCRGAASCSGPPC